jgi:hypothetical protein
MYPFTARSPLVVAACAIVLGSCNPSPANPSDASSESAASVTTVGPSVEFKARIEQEKNRQQAELEQRTKAEDAAALKRLDDLAKNKDVTDEQKKGIEAAKEKIKNEGSPASKAMLAAQVEADNHLDDQLKKAESLPPDKQGPANKAALDDYNNGQAARTDDAAREGHEKEGDQLLGLAGPAAAVAACLVFGAAATVCGLVGVLASQLFGGGKVSKEDQGRVIRDVTSFFDGTCDATCFEKKAREWARDPAAVQKAIKAAIGNFQNPEGRARTEIALQRFQQVNAAITCLRAFQGKKATADTLIQHIGNDVSCQPVRKTGLDKNAYFSCLSGHDIGTNEGIAKAARCVLDLDPRMAQ